ncbi:MAG: hypothetical protein ACRD1K_21090 [Acidimicrobiales bacterium]
MRRQPVTATLVALVATAAVTAAMAAGVPLVGGTRASTEGCRAAEPDSKDAERPLWVVLAGHNGSDADDVDAHLAHLRSVVVPAAAAVSARLVVALIEADSDREPRVVADVRVGASGPAADNDEVQRRAVEAATKKVDGCLSDALDEPAAPRSDPFGAVTWASTVMSTTPSSARHLVLLSDAVSTTASCNLSGRDLRPEARPALLAECTPGPADGLEGATAWLAGVGRGAGTDPAPGSIGEQALTPSVLIELWQEFFVAHGARLTRAGVTLLPGTG